VEDLEPWRQETTAGFGVRVFPGGHFYLDSLRQRVLAEVEAILRPCMIPAGGPPPR
jgi:surfactin synthase thioesterase subunit